MKKINLKNMTLREQIVLVVVLLSVVPLILFGLYSLQIAGKSQQNSDKVKNTLMINIGREVENYFADLNEYLNFTRTIEKRLLNDEIEISKVLLEALTSNKDVLSIAYVKNSKISLFFGEEIKIPDNDTRLTHLLKEYSGDQWVNLSSSFANGKSKAFDILYPMKNNTFVFITFKLNKLNAILLENRISQTGMFAVLKQDGSVFSGEEILNTRLSFLEIADKLNVSDETVIIERSRGYEIKAKKLENILWPFWLVYTQKTSESHALMNRLRLSIISILLMLFFISGSISYVLSDNFSRPISNLLTAVKKNFSGELEEKAVLDDRDSGELAILIKEFNRLIDNLRETRGQLVEKEKLAAVGEMANVIGHDIRNPLAAIKNGAYYIRYAAKSENPRVVQTLDIIDREIESIKQIIEDLLGFSRQRPPALSTVAVNELLEEVISIVEVPENVTLGKDFQEDISEYQLDRGEMRQVLVNLINNAVQAINKDEGVVTVITKTEANQDLCIIIKDNGMGIPEDKLNKIFEAFYSTKEGGTGLGLASAKRIVERHQGKLNIRSTQNVGTELIINIPKEIIISKET